MLVRFKYGVEWKDMFKLLFILVIIDILEVNSGENFFLEKIKYMYVEKVRNFIIRFLF